MSFSSACCSLPPVEANYTPKGEYTEVTGLKSYITGPADAKKVVVIVYDIFGFSPQIVQGADLIASQGFKVIMPDFMNGIVAEGAWFGPNPTEEQQAAKAKFFGGFPGAITSQSKPVGDVISFVKSTGAEKVAVVGYCWGYKVVVATDGLSGVNAVAGCHPSFAAPEDAKAFIDNGIPVALLASENEDKEVMKAIFEALEAKKPGKNVLKTFDGMPHGWMAARGDLSGGNATEQYRIGYETLTTFLKASL